jgi:hypothetical protein
MASPFDIGMQPPTYNGHLTMVKHYIIDELKVDDELQ